MVRRVVKATNALVGGHSWGCGQVWGWRGLVALGASNALRGGGEAFMGMQAAEELGWVGGIGGTKRTAWWGGRHSWRSRMKVCVAERAALR